MTRKLIIGDFVSLYQKQQTKDFIITKAEVVSVDEHSATIKDMETGKILSAPLSTLTLNESNNKSKEKFNFYTFLSENSYEKDTIRDASGKTFCTNYQKELSENIWNSLTVHKDKTITGASPKAGIVFKQIPQPETKEDAELLLSQIEQIPDHEV